MPVSKQDLDAYHRSLTEALAERDKAHAAANEVFAKATAPAKAAFDKAVAAATAAYKRRVDVAQAKLTK